MINLETQEAGTGKWFPIIIYTPGTWQQLAAAKSAAKTLRDVFGLHARLTPIPEGTHE